MPCTYDDPNERRINGDELTRLRHAEAVLCGVFHVLEDDMDKLDSILSQVDWKEVGLKSKWAYNWWSEHKKKDAVRHARERVEKERKLKVAAARSKLTDEEIALLGINDED